MDSIFQKTYFKKVLKNFLASGYHIARKNKSMIELCSYLKIGKKSNCETFFFSKWDMKKIEKFARDTYGNEFVDSIKPKKFFDDFEDNKQGISMPNFSAINSTLALTDGSVFELKDGAITTLNKSQFKKIDFKKIKKLCVLGESASSVNLELIVKALPAKYQDFLFIYQNEDIEDLVFSMIKKMLKTAELLVFFDYNVPSLQEAADFVNLHKKTKVVIPAKESLSKLKKYSNFESNSGDDMEFAQALSMIQMMDYMEDIPDHMLGEIDFLQSKNLSLSVDTIISKGGKLTTV